MAADGCRLVVNDPAEQRQPRISNGDGRRARHGLADVARLATALED